MALWPCGQDHTPIMTLPRLTTIDYNSKHEIMKETLLDLNLLKPGFWIGIIILSASNHHTRLIIASPNGAVLNG